jgi:imidazolonepropionase-like amidohydrolase
VRARVAGQLGLGTAVLAMLAAAASVAAQTPDTSPAQPTALLVSRLLDPTTGTYRRDVVVRIDSGRVTAVVPQRDYRRGTERVIDVTGLTVLPGLIDAHVHLALAGTPRENAMATLRSGFTTVADLGEVDTRILELRDSIAAGTVPGPNVLAAGLWIGRSGGICEFGGIGVKGDTAAYRARVRENLAAGADLIKVCVSKWLLAAYRHPDQYEIDDAALGVVVDEAHRGGRKVIAHDLSLAGVRTAVRVGVDGFAHGALVDSAAALEMRRRGVFMIPTLLTLAGPASGDAGRALTEGVLLAQRLGVPIVFGTDAGVLAHGENAREAEVLVKAGIPALTAVQAMTVTAARALGIEDRAGRVIVGHPADIIAVEGDPLADITALQRVRFVIRGGRVYRERGS